MQQLNVHDYYDLGKKIDNIEREIAKAGSDDYSKRGIAWPLFMLRWSLDEIIRAMRATARFSAGRESCNKVD